MENGHALSVCNARPKLLPGPSALHHLVPRNVEPGTIAIDHLSEDGSRVFFDYGQLHDQADALCEVLIGLLVERRTSKAEPLVIPVLLPQSPQLYIALLAILKSGGAFCPIGLDSPPERIKFILKDVSAPLVVTTSNLASSFQDGKDEILTVLVDEFHFGTTGTCAATSAELRAYPQTPLPHDLAYVMYTSGSTGLPKGVGVSHRAATQSLLAHDRHIPPFKRFLQFATPTFDVSVFEIFFPLFRGCTLVSTARSRLLNDLSAVMKELEVDACELTPSVAGSLLRTRQNAPSLQLLLTIGEMLTTPVVMEFGGKDDQMSMLWAMYGPTEAAIHCTLQSRMTSSSSPRNIGVPLDTVSAFVIKYDTNAVSDAAPLFDLLPMGEVGELALGGHQLAEGYINRPEQTSAAFLNTDFGRVYRTGDKARMNLNGTIECLGRISDGQVKLRGQRMELGEIEQAGLRTQGCHGTVAAVISNVLVLFCAVDDFDDIVEHIRTSCKTWLPAAMIPGDIVVSAEFPRLASGKIDRKRLVQEYTVSKSDVSRSSPIDELTRALFEAVESVVGVEVTSYSLLSAIGMDSLNAIRLASDLRKLGFSLTVVDILSCRTTAALLHLATSSRTRAVNVLHPTVDFSLSLGACGLEVYSKDIEKILPCTNLQVSMLTETSRDAAMYNNWIELEFPETFEIELIKDAFTQIFERNEIFRTGFALSKNSFVQVVWKEFDRRQIQVVQTFRTRDTTRSSLDHLRPLQLQIASKAAGRTPRALLHLHHALYDGWSLELLILDLCDLVESRPLKVRPQFWQASEFLISRETPTELDREREFWTGYFNSYRPQAMPVFIGDNSGESRLASTTKDLGIKMSTLKKALISLECTPPVLIQGAVCLIWGMLTGAEDVLIGTVTSGRTAAFPGLERVMGPFMATRPARVNMSGSMTIQDVLDAIRASNLSTMRHDLLGLAEIKKILRLQPGQQLFDLLFVYQETIFSDRIRKCPVREVAHRDFLESSVLVEAFDADGSLKCSITADTSLLGVSLAESFLEMLGSTLSYMLDSPTSNIQSIFSTVDELLLSRSNIAPSLYPGANSLSEVVEDVATRNPGNQAISFARSIESDTAEETVLTFEQLNLSANRVARYIRRQNKTNDEVVAIVMEKSLLFYICVLATLKSGSAYLPLLPNTPKSRIRGILQQAGVKLCLMDRDAANKSRDLLLEFSVVDVEDIDFGVFPDDNLAISTDISAPAYVIYTSGTTGAPKGVTVSHRNILSNINVLSRIYPTNSSSRLLQACSQAFDVSVFEIFFSWVKGICLCVATNDTLFGDIEKCIRLLGVTHLSMTTTVASLVRPENVPNVEFLVTSGEPMTEPVSKAWAGYLYQGYGPSETTNICTVHKMKPGYNIRYLGPPLENTSAFVMRLDEASLVPFGCIGELCFGGDQVTIGYLNQPALTASKFIQHPMYGRVYRSGDLGRILPDGGIIILGRVDDQVKLRGFRVEPGEISTHLERSPLVRAATTVVAPGGPQNSERLVSFFVPAERTMSASKTLVLGQADTDLEINKRLFGHVKAALPEYMTPSCLIPITHLPLTSSGKVDKGFLRKAYMDLPVSYLEFASDVAETSADSDTPWSGMELEIVNAIASMTAIEPERLRRWTSFSSIGLDSIATIRLARLLTSKLGRRVQMSTILNNSCVGILAERLGRIPRTSKLQFQGNGDALSSLAEAFTPDLIGKIQQDFEDVGFVVREVLPCMPLQEAMAAAASTSTSAYQNRMLLELHGDEQAMRQSWQEVMRRHDIFKTCFVTTTCNRYAVAQVVVEGWQPQWQEFDATSTSVASCVARHAALVPRALNSFKPPHSLAIINSGSSKFLSFVCHHCLYDGVAMSKLLEDVEATLSSDLASQPPPYVRFLEEALLKAEGDGEFWASMLADFRSPLISGQDSVSFEGAGEMKVLDTLQFPLRDIEDFSKSLGVTKASIFETAWALTLGICIDRQDVCFGRVMSGRSVPIPGIDDLIAPCFNTVPIRVEFSTAPNLASLLKDVNKRGAELYDHQFAALRRLKAAWGRPGLPLFDTILLVQEPPRQLDEAIWSLVQDEGDMDVPLLCELIPQPNLDTIRLRLQYDTSILQSSFVTSVQELFGHLVRTLLYHPWSRLPQRNAVPSTILRTLESRPIATRPSGTDINNALDAGSVLDPATETESRVMSLLMSLSNYGSSTVTKHTTIYQLGLDSISAVQVSSLARKEFKVALTAVDVIENPTSFALSRRILELLDNTSVKPSQASAFQQLKEVIRECAVRSVANLGDFESVLPCTPAQQGMLVAFLTSNGRNYFNFFELSMDAGISAEDIRQAWVSLVSCHPILRTGFVEIEHRVVPFAMVTYPSDALVAPVHVVDGTFVKEQWRSEVAARVLKSMKEPPWEVAIYADNGVTSVAAALHHSLYDATSLQRILGDLARFLRGVRPSPSKSLEPIVRADFGHSLMTEDTSVFWKSQAPGVNFNGFPVLTPLNSTQSRLVSTSKQLQTSLDSVQEAVVRHNITIQAAIQATWTRILAAYCGDANVVFGTVMSTRQDESDDDAVFPLLRTVPTITKNASSNRQLLDSAMACNTSLHKHLFTPMATVKRLLGHPDASLFDTVVVYQKGLGRGSDVHPWRFHEEHSVTEYVVSVEVEPERTGHLRVTIAVLDNAVPIQQARLILDQFEAVFLHLLQQPDGSEAELSMNHPTIHSHIPAKLTALPSNITLLHQFLEESAARVPNSTALLFTESVEQLATCSKSWSYRQLNDMGNRVARLISAQVTSRSIVAVQFGKCPEAYFAILGILKAGCAFVALDPSAPISRKEFILKDSGASMLIISSSTQIDTPVSGMGIRLLRLSEQVLADTSREALDPTRMAQPEDACYCLYTSGTTGLPKGCIITHDNAAQALLAFQTLFDGRWDVDSRWLQFASFHFDVSVLEQYWTWSVGVTLVSVPREVILDDLARTISALDITHIDLTPSLARLIRPSEVPSLCKGIFITGGEQLRQDVLDAWGDTGVIYNAYGPTEATIGVTMFRSVPRNGRPTNIGSQFPNVGTLVLRLGTDDPVLRGAVGELCLSGKLVGRGYLNRDELTAAKFPILERLGERVYRTGDLVRLLYDGSFEFLGRADDQIKLRGQRLEASEINHCIRAGVAEVLDVCTTVVDRSSGEGAQLVSFIVTDNLDLKGRPLEVMHGARSQRIARKAVAMCKEKLPGYMVPTFVVHVPYIPLSANNKADLRQLKTVFKDLSHGEVLALSGLQSAPENSQVVPSVTLGKIMTCLQEQGFIDAADAQPHANIYELGVDSISVLRFTRALNRVGFVKASAALVLQSPKLLDLASALERQSQSDGLVAIQTQGRLILKACYHQNAAAVSRALGVGLEEIEYIAPCSPLQLGILSRSAQRPSQGLYFNTFRYRAKESTRQDELHAAWLAVVQRHPILRTSFLSVSEGAIQVARRRRDHDVLDVKVSRRDTIDAVFATYKEQWLASNADQIVSPFQVIIAHADDVVEFQIHLFHAIYDGVTFDIILDGLQTECTGMKTVDKVPSFLDALVSGPLQDFGFCKAFWTNHLESATVEALPTLREPVAGIGTISASRDISFKHLDRIRRSLGASHQSLLQALWLSVLTRFAPRTNIMGLIISGRSAPLENIENIAGPLFNTIPFHWVPGSAPSWRSLVGQCQEFNAATMSFQHVPLRLVQKWCGNGRAMFDCLFSFRWEQESPRHGVELWTSIGEHSVADYPLAFEASLDSRSNLKVTIVAQSQLCDGTRLYQFLDDFDRSIQQICSDPEAWLWPDKPLDTEPISSQNPPNERPLEPRQLIDVEGMQDFTWDTTAETIRDQVAFLAGVSARQIPGEASILELGLDSIDAIRLSSRLKERGINTTASTIMRHLTLKAIRKAVSYVPSVTLPVDNEAGGPNEKVTPTWLLELRDQFASGDTGVESIYPTTPLQDSMVAEMLRSDFGRYFNHEIMELAPEVDTRRLAIAWSRVIQQNPILRTTFDLIVSTETDLAYCQVVHSKDQSFVCHANLRHPSDLAAVVADARDRAKSSAGKSDLVQLAFASLGNTRYLILSMAHALYDGWSINLLHQDVRAAYFDRLESRPPWQEDVGKSNSGPEAVEFWSNYLKDAFPTLVAHKTRTEEFAPKVHRLELVSVVATLTAREFCKSMGITMQVLGLACWSAVLATCVRSLDVTFGVVLSGRTTEDDQKTMFPMMNTVAVRCLLHGTIRQYLQYLQQNMSQIMQHQRFPLRKAQRVPSVPTDSLFNTLFIQQFSPPPDPSHSAEIDLIKATRSDSALDYPLCIEIELADESFVWRIGSSGTCQSEEEAASLLKQLDSTLQRITSNSNGPVLEINGEEVSACSLPRFKPPGDGSGASRQAPPTVPGHSPGPWSQTGEIIRRILSRVSGIPESSIEKDHNLFNIGIDSIGVIKVSTLLRREGVNLRSSDLFGPCPINDLIMIAEKWQDGPVSDLSRSLPRSNGAERASQSLDPKQLLRLGPLSQQDIAATLPATPMQVHMLSVWQNSKGKLFCPEFCFSLSGSVSMSQFRQAWQTVISSTPILRTRFLATEHGDAQPFLQVLLNQEAVEKYSREIQEGDASYTWSSDSSGLQLLGLSAARRSDTTLELKLNIHHALYDAVSLSTIIRRLKQSCSGVASVNVRASADAEWASWEKAVWSHSDSIQVEARKDFWTTYLLALDPVQNLWTNIRTMAGPSSTFKPSVLVVRDLKNCCLARGVSFQALFFAAYAKVLSSLRAAALLAAFNQDLVFGVYIANRFTLEGTEHAAFPTLCILPLRVCQATSHDIWTLASDIQGDLQRISRPTNTAVSLWEIGEWTGLRVDSFVNFLSSPPEEGSRTLASSVNITTEWVDLSATQDQPQEGQVARCESESLTPNWVRDWYPAAVDIEAAINGDFLDIGVFDAAGSVGRKSSEIVELICEELSAARQGQSS